MLQVGEKLSDQLQAGVLWKLKGEWSKQTAQDDDFVSPAARHEKLEPPEFPRQPLLSESRGSLKGPEAWGYGGSANHAMAQNRFGIQILGRGRHRPF